MSKLSYTGGSFGFLMHTKIIHCVKAHPRHVFKNAKNYKSNVTNC